MDFHRVPANSPVAKFLNDVTSPDQRLLISCVDDDPVLLKISRFIGSSLGAMIVVPLTLWCLFSSSNTWYCVVYLFLYDFIALPTPQSWTMWDLLKSLLVYWLWSLPDLRWYWLFFTDFFIPRLCLGFHPTDIIFRKFPNHVEVDAQLIEQGCSIAHLSLTNPASRDCPEMLNARLDLSASAVAHNRVERGEIEENTWRASVWLKDKEGWTVCEVWKEYGRAQRAKYAAIEYD